MIQPLRAHLVASRHREIVGKPVRSWRIGTGGYLPLVLVGIWILLGVVLVINPFESMVSNVAFMLFFGLVLIFAALVAADARFVVCERGVLMGRLIPGLPLSPTYVIAGREIDPRTVCVVGNVVKAANEIGMGTMFSQVFTYPVGPMAPQGVSFQGPWGAEIEANRDVQLHRPNPKSLFLFGHRRADRLADALLQAIGRDGGIPQGFAPHEGLRPIPVSGNREDAVRQIPGAWPQDPPPQHP